MRNFSNTRASDADEAEQLVQHRATVDIKRIAIVDQNNMFDAECAAKKIVASASASEVVSVGLVGKLTIGRAMCCLSAEAQPSALLSEWFPPG